MTGGDPPAAPGPFAHKIRSRHRDRLAVVYVRQSSPHQVAENRESADLQYQLRRRAVELGWSGPRVLVIDDDQGCSGLSIDNRPGVRVHALIDNCKTEVFPGSLSFHRCEKIL